MAGTKVRQVQSPKRASRLVARLAGSDPMRTTTALEGKDMSEKQNAVVERLRKYDKGADEIERLRAALNGIVEVARSSQEFA